MTQAFVNQGNNPLGLRLLAKGFLPAHVLSELQANDPHYEYRQIAVIDRNGRLAAYSGPKNRGWAVTSRATATSPWATSSPDRRSSRRWPRRTRRRRRCRSSGGCWPRSRPGAMPAARSATTAICRALGRGDGLRRYDHAELDLRVDLHDTAVEELRRAFEEYELYRGYYRERGKNPKDAIPQIEFVAQLQRKQEAAQ
jgi:uncharacterized Ntn-hydrolase superfamily protein